MLKTTRIELDYIHGLFWVVSETYRSEPYLIEEMFSGWFPLLSQEDQIKVDEIVSRKKRGYKHDQSNNPRSNKSR